MFLRIGKTLHKITHYFINNRDITPIFTNLVGVNPWNIHTKFDANPCSSYRDEVKKVQRQGRRRTQGDHKSHSHTLSVTKNTLKY